ncbi:MAG: MFS transporter [Parachlamydiales bacterium]|nr:MFS transporter [Parachlamydiales bacterium]
MIGKKLSLFSIFFTFFIDNLGWSIVFPIFAPLFLDPHNTIFDSSFSSASRTTVLGVFLAAYPLAQFFGAPILGELSDRLGRKKALLLSIFFTVIGYVLTAISVQHQFLSLLFVSRVITGVFSGNLSVCLAAISDISSTKTAKLRYFGYFAVLAGFSFIVGAYLGGKFSDKEVYLLFSPDFPLWIAAALSFINLLFIIWGFEETLEMHKHATMDILESVHNVQQALHTKKIQTVYVVYFLFLLGWTILFQFMPVLVIQKFFFTSSKIGDLAAIMGLGWAIGSGVLSKLLSNFFSFRRILEGTLIVFAPLCALVVFPHHSSWVYIIFGLCVLIGGISWPIYISLISNMAPPKMQGKILGMTQSVQSLAMGISPIIGGLLDHVYFPLPFFFAAATALFAAIVYFRNEGF